MTHALKIIEVLGILAFAMSGILEARKKGLDVVGIYFVAMITAFGGGTVRDILLNHYPLFWIQHAEYPVVVLVLCLISYLGIARLFDHARGIWLVVIFDALGLGLFCAAGMSLALSCGLTVFNVVLMGVITGAFGGVMRDIICNEIPVVFRRTELYVTCVLAGAAAFLILHYLVHQPFWALGGCVLFVFASRILAHHYQWRLPV